MADLRYPGIPPGAAIASLDEGEAILANAVIRCVWSLAGGRVRSLRVENRESGQSVVLAGGVLPTVRLGKERIIDPAELEPREGFQCGGNAISARFADAASGLQLDWSARLGDNDNAVIQTLRLTAINEIQIQEIIFMDAEADDARQVGEVDGSVVVCEDIFMGVEHPLAKNVVGGPGHIRCALALGGEWAAGDSREYTSVIGVTPPGQLRRGFLYYLERRRIHPYRQFLHYNNWYDVWLGRQTERMTEAEALAAIAYYGRELVEKRGVKVDAVVWDDGWDDFNTLWDFHKGFPHGFRNLMAAAGKHGIAQGVWMSPNGGYATAKAARIAYGKPRGYETNENGYAMGGAKYRKAFHDVCRKMIRENGVVFFKFDGMGEGGSGEGHTTGTTGSFSNDIHAILELSRALHREKPAVYVSATAGTWASPFWLLYADNIWRQGGDSGHHGAGNTRQQWITYRDMFCYERVVQVGPIYPLNSVMLHGILIGNRPNRAPGKMVLDEKSVADEIWSFFASGTCLQELYVSPGVPTETMLDHIAEAAKWARANEGVLVDTHWVGGNPGKGEVYGRASWQPGKGILTLRNPSDEPQTFTFSITDVLELPEGVEGQPRMQVVYPHDRLLPVEATDVTQEVKLTLESFETIVIEMEWDTGCEERDDQGAGRSAPLFRSANL